MTKITYMKNVFHDFIIRITEALFHKVYKLYLNENLLENRNTCIVNPGGSFE